MKNKLVFRIFGALASALIIVSVFIPFIKVTGYSPSLWQSHSLAGTLYLPIMIIVFGAIGVLFFSINIKTELAYATSGALTFFLVMQTIPVIDQGTFKALGVGYYCLAIGTILTGIMAFICNFRTKQKEIKNVTDVPNTISMIDQIDKLYNDQNNSNNNIENVIQPIPLDANIINNSIPVENNFSNEVEMNSDNQVINPIQNLEQPVVNIQSQATTEIVSEQQISEPVQVNPVVTEFNVPVQQPVQVNPVVTEFNVPVQESTNNQPKFDVMGEPQTNNNQSNLDIFG